MSHSMPAPQTGGTTGFPGTLRVLAVDDELPALAELAYLLGENEHITSVSTAASGQDALRILQSHPIDVIFLDIKMPGLDGLELARVFARFASPPKVVFVTAYDDFAVDAFELEATDYVLKPLRQERLADAVRRVFGPEAASGQAGGPADVDETIAVERGGVTRFVARGDVRYVEAQGDYVRLHTAEGSHLVRIPLAALEERWAGAGFMRIHRRHLVALAHIDELYLDGGRLSVRVGDAVLQVSRRHTRDLRDVLLRQPPRTHP